MQLSELDKLFRRLEIAGIKSILLFSRDGEIIKSTFNEDETNILIRSILDVIGKSNKVLKNLLETKANINQLKVISENMEVNIIVGKRYILAYKNNKPRMEVYERYLDVATSIDNLYK